MKRSELKDIIKEAIKELIDEGAFNSVIPNLSDNEQVKDISNHDLSLYKKQGLKLSETITQQSSKVTNPQEKALLSLLADTAKTTYVTHKETEKLGATSESIQRSNQQLNQMFPKELREHFHNLFAKKVE